MNELEYEIFVTGNNTMVPIVYYITSFRFDLSEAFLKLKSKGVITIYSTWPRADNNGILISYKTNTPKEIVKMRGKQ